MTASEFLKQYPSNILTSNTSYGVSSAFILSNSILIIPSVLIIISVLAFNKMRSVGNLVMMQIAVLDIMYAIFAISWHSIKIATGGKFLTYELCQVEGGFSSFFMASWLYSAAFCAYWRYYSVVYGDEISKRRTMLIVSLQWLLPLGLATSIAVIGKFDLMPSGGYCHLIYRKDDPILILFYCITLFVILIPTVLAIYFYISLTKQCFVTAHRVNERELTKNPLGTLLSDTESKADLMTNKKPLVSYYNCHSVAYRTVTHCIIFIFSFLPLGIAMIAEMITDSPRSAEMDTFVVSAILIHKVLSPITTLFINTPILNQVKKLVGL